MSYGKNFLSGLFYAPKQKGSIAFLVVVGLAYVGFLLDHPRCPNAVPGPQAT